jgi:hypothetical protein
MSTQHVAREARSVRLQLLITRVCSRACSGRFRYVDWGNQPKGCSEVAAFYKARNMFLHPALFLLGDVAYRSDERCKTGYVAKELTVPVAGSAAEAARRRAYNVALSSARQRVEHAFSRLKHTFRLLQATWNMPLERLPKTFRACCLLANWLGRTRQLYLDM